jgi:uncharacterized BrkB/YihY/UPF0761 family membrane protein
MTLREVVTGVLRRYDERDLLVLGWYLTTVADYGSIFGALATAVIVLTYLYFASAAFLTGALLDALVRGRVDRSAVSRG